MNYKSIKSIFVYGAGSWGTALGSYFSSIGKNTIIFSRNANTSLEINNNHRNSKYLNQTVLDSSLKSVNYIDCIVEHDLIVLAITSQSFDEVLEILINLNINLNVKFLIATKGFCQNPVELISKRFAQKLDNEFAFITGPNLATEVVEKKYSTATISSKDISFAKFLSLELNSDRFVMGYSDNIITMQVASILKNIFAIKSGILGYESYYGENAYASLIVEYLNEIRSLAIASGGDCEDLISYGVLSDLIVTNYSKNSRNYRFGYQAKANGFDRNFVESYPTLVEGLNALRIIKFFKPKNISLPHIESLIKLFDF